MLGGRLKNEIFFAEKSPKTEDTSGEKQIIVHPTMEMECAAKAQSYYERACINTDQILFHWEHWQRCVAEKHSSFGCTVEAG